MEAHNLKLRTLIVRDDVGIAPDYDIIMSNCVNVTLCMRMTGRVIVRIGMQ